MNELQIFLFMLLLKS